MSDALPTGHVVAGRYRITRYLGAGAMASVYSAEQDSEPRHVALKVMNAELSKNPSFVRRFEREAKAASVVRHPNSVRIMTFGSSEGRNYIVMELLSGDSLASCLEKQGPFGSFFGSVGANSFTSSATPVRERSVTAQIFVLRVPTKVTTPCGPTAMCRASGTRA